MPVAVYPAADTLGSLPLSSDRGQENDSDMRKRTMAIVTGAATCLGNLVCTQCQKKPLGWFRL